MKRCLTVFILILTLIFSSTAMSFASVDPDVAIVNPVSYSTVTSTNLLVSVKLTKAKTIKVTVTEEQKSIDSTAYPLSESDMKAIQDGTFTGKRVSRLVLDGDSFTSTNNLSFYTKKLEKNITPGVYRIRVDTIFQGKITHTGVNYVLVKSKAADSADLFDSSSSGTATFLQNLLKSIFGGD
ncbi:hypothetical protein [Clostridium aminobutyricum]|uniref:Uncharacterized protein n=1 Tax=Clostridium aminobutyricum TaxID=33953 RepID=A0A939IIQ1_CLOAM|nr:hypothetical protein [Clostridium aminobutyricum]MBN7773306.1 hypothetical protein [Clostridium aminobutyricum]